MRTEAEGGEGGSGLVPSDLPDGVNEVVIVDDTADVTADLAAHPAGLPDRISIVHHNDLAVSAEERLPFGSA